MSARLSLFRHENGVETEAGNRVVYDVEANEARFGAASAPGRALVWELHDDAPVGALLSAEVELDEAHDWLIRCDRVDFPPRGVAYRHTHPGPGIRCLLAGSIRIEGPDDLAKTIEPFGAWFEDADYPVLATASPTEPTSFVRTMLVPTEWAGKRTIRYVNAEDAERPKTQQATVFLEASLLPFKGRAAGSAGCDPWGAPRSGAS